jgi:hypothetical protein
VFARCNDWPECPQTRARGVVGRVVVGLVFVVRSTSARDSHMYPYLIDTPDTCAAKSAASEAFVNMFRAHVITWPE